VDDTGVEGELGRRIDSSLVRQGLRQLRCTATRQVVLATKQKSSGQI